MQITNKCLNPQGKIVFPAFESARVDDASPNGRRTAVPSRIEEH